MLICITTLKAWGIVPETYPEPDPKRFISASMLDKVKKKIKFLTQSLNNNNMIAQNTNSDSEVIKDDETAQSASSNNEVTVHENILNTGSSDEVTGHENVTNIDIDPNKNANTTNSMR